MAAALRVGTETVAGNTVSFMLRPGGETYVVFLHGLGCNKASFVDAFEGDWFDTALSLFAPDFPGHADSPRDSAYAYDLHTQADEILEVLRRLEARRVIVVAHSMGNICGLRLAETVQHVEGYYCLEGNLVETDCQLSKRIAKFGESAFVSKFHPIAKKQFVCPSCDERGADPLALFRSATSLVEHCADDKPLQTFVDLDMPKAYFHGSRNAAMPVLSRLGDIDIVEVPDAGHFVMNDAPSFVWSEIAKRIRASNS